MKKIFTLLFLSCGTLFAQEKYCEIITYKPTRPNARYEIAIDSGQVDGWVKANGHGFKKDGKIIEFNTPVDVLNYMTTRGWVFVQVYSTNTISTGVNFMNVHYLLKKVVRVKEN